MRKKVFSLMMALLAIVGVARAQELTVCDGTTTNGYVPVYGFYADAYLKCQYILPADQLAAMNNKSICSMKFYSSTTSANWGAASFNVYVTETTATTISAFIDPSTATTVYTGSLSISGGQMTVNFNTPFMYHGGNLLVGFDNTVCGSYVSASFYGVSSTGSCVQGYSYSALSAITPTARDFLPKTTFVYLGPTEIVVNPNPIELGERPSGSWMRPLEVNITNNGSAADITAIDVTNSFFTIEGEIPGTLSYGENIALDVNHGEGEGDIEGNLLIAFAGRDLMMIPMTATAYTPVTPDTWEMAQELSSFPYEATVSGVHDNYLLPGSKPDGNDAVYKIVANTDMVLNADITSGANGKMAVYTEDFNDFGGPHNNNNYTGPQEGQGGGGTEGDEFFYNFEDGTLGDFTLIDADGDGYNWMNSADLLGSGYGYNGSAYCVLSQSYSNTSGVLYPDNYLVSPQVTIGDGATFSFYACGQDASYCAEHYGVAISTTGNTSASDFTTIWEETFSGRGDRDQTAWVLKSIDLSAYAGQQVYIALRHFNCYDEFYLDVDDIALTNGRGNRSGREIVEIGDGGTDATAYLPSYSFYNYSLTQQIYTAEEIGMAGTISSISFYNTSAVSTTRNFDVYLVHTNKTNFTGSQDWITVTDTDKVFSGSVAMTSGLWNVITFDTPFEYDGESNLAIVMDDNTGSYVSGVQYSAFTTSTTQALRIYSDDTNYNPLNPGSHSGTTHGYKNQIQLDIEPAAGQYLVTNMTLVPGTYYLAASSTDDSFDVMIDLTEAPCPEQAYNPSPADAASQVNTSGSLTWHNGAYTTGVEVYFGTAYNNLEKVYDSDENEGQLINSYRYSGLYNNKNYFWRVDTKNNGCTTTGQVWGFTTTLNEPTNLVAADYTIFEGETAQLSWTAIQDRTFRKYNIYQNGICIGNTTNTTYDVEGLAYNMGGYNMYVTAVYDEGESGASNAISVRVSGNGNIAGYVYELDGTTGVEGATVTFRGKDEFNDNQTFTFTTGANGAYSGLIKAGKYDGVASKEEYQDATCEQNPVNVYYNELASDVNFILDEIHNPIDWVLAEEQGDNVLVSWGKNWFIREDFETGDFSMFDWSLPSSYPFEITTNNPYEGTYCIQSTNAGVDNSTSSIEVTVDIPRNGLMSFYEKISCESGFDNGYFYIDGVQKGSYTGIGNWTKKEYEVTEGTHTFKWAFTKDISLGSGEDRFFVDYIDFIYDPQPLEPGWIYYDDGTNVDAIGLTAGGSFMWGVRFPASMMAGFAGCSLTKASLFDYSAHTGKVMIYQGGATAPATLIHQQPYTCTGIMDFVEMPLTTALPIDPTQDLWVVMNNDNGQYVASACNDTGDPNGRFITTDGVTWDDIAALGLPYTWMIRAYVSDGAKTTVLSSDNAVKAVEPEYTLSFASVNDLTVDPAETEPHTVATATRGGDRAFSYYNVWRTDCYTEDYTEENTVKLASHVTDTIYMDMSWGTVEPGVYKWGVSCVYEGNHGRMIETPISWGATQSNEQSFTPCRKNRVQAMTKEDLIKTTSLAPKSENNEAPIVYHPEMLRGNTAYACNAYGGTNPEGWISYDVDAPGAGTSINSGLTVYGGSIAADGYVYATYNDNYWYKIDPLTGEVLGTGYLGMFFVDCTYDYTTDVMYGSYSGTLYTWDLVNNTTATIGTMAESMQMIACDRQGNLYGLAYSTGILYSIDKTNGACTQIGSTGYSPAYVQSGGFDLNTGKLYWAGYTTTGIFAEIDPATAQTTLIASNVGEQLSWCVPYSYNPGPTPGGLLGEHESNFVWSNCLDKDMNTMVAVTVALNSGEEPTGASVTFTNVGNEPDVVYNTTLDETGYYVWDEFRKGEYEVKVTLDGYSTVTETVSIWGPASFEYVLEEVIAGIENLYVSSTGWAMWDGQGGPVGPTGGDEFSFSFDNDLEGWTNIDADGDGEVWYHSTAAGNHSTAAITSHSGTGHLMSESYCNASYAALNPNNFIVTPQKYGIGSGSTFSFYACAQDASYPSEHFGVAISEAGNTSASDFTTIQEWTLTAKGGNNVPASATRNGKGNREGNWYQFTCDLSSYAGKQVYIAIRHFNVSDQFIICVDDAELTTGAKAVESVQKYKVMLNGAYAGETMHPFFQFDADNLVVGETYTTKVAAVYATGMGPWSNEWSWVYDDCANYEGATDVTASGNTVTWTYPNVGPVPPTQGDTFTEGFDNGLDGWTTIDGNGDGHNWYHSTEAGNHGTLAITSHSGAGHLMSESYCNATYQALNPNDFIVSPQMYGIANGSTLSFWCCAQDASYPSEHFGVAISTTGNTNASDFTTIQEWTLTAKGGSKANPAATRNGKGNREGNWYNFTCDLSAYAGQQVWIAIRHFNVSDQFIICLDDMELTCGAKANRDYVFDQAQYVTDPGQINGHDASNLQGAQSTYGPNANFASDYYVGDDFTLDAATTITSIEVYGYQTGSTTTSTFNGLYAQIYDGNPMSGGQVVWGDMSTNLMTATAWTDCYRAMNDMGTTRPIMSVTAEGLNIDLAAGTYYIVWGLTGTGTSGPWGQPVAIAGQTNTGNGIQWQAGSWASLSDSGCGDPYGMAFRLGGAGGPIPPTPTEGVLGAMIFRDGEWIGQVDAPVNSFTDESGDFGEFCVRVIYGGDMNAAPELGTYYCMSCPACAEGGCPAPEGLYAEQTDGSTITVTWPYEEPVGPVSDWLYYDNGTMASSIGTGGSGIYWGIMIPAANLPIYAGCSLTQVAVMEYETGGSYTLNIYYGGATPNVGTLVHSQTFSTTGTLDWKYIDLTTALPLDVTQNLWITMYQANIDYPATCCNNTGDANGRWVATDGTDWMDVVEAGLSYTWMIRGYVTNEAKGGEIVALPAFKGESNSGAELGSCGSLNVTAEFAPKATTGIDHFVVERSFNNQNNYEEVGTVNAGSATVWSFNDNMSSEPAGSYYYRVYAVYEDGCESDYATAYDNPDNRYVVVSYDAIGENGENGVSVYPNPVKNILNVVADGMSRISVVNALGQVVYDMEVNDSNATIDMSSFAEGTYMLRIVTESGVSVKRVAVVR